MVSYSSISTSLCYFLFFLVAHNRWPNYENEICLPVASARCSLLCKKRYEVIQCFGNWNQHKILWISYSMASSSEVDNGIFDCLPSIRRPMAWETPGRSRQIKSPQQSDTDSAHCSDESFARMSTGNGWRSVHSSASSPGPGGRRSVIEVYDCAYSYAYHIFSTIAEPLSNTATSILYLKTGFFIRHFC